MSKIVNNSTIYPNSPVQVSPTIIDREPSESISDEEVLQLEHIIHQTHPTDQICLTDSGVDCLVNLLMTCKNLGGKDAEGKCWISSDIFFAQTVPILDCEIELTNDKMSAPPILYRVSIFPDYIEKIEKAGFEDVTFVGFIQFHKEFLALGVKKGKDELLSAPLINSKNNKIVNSVIWCPVPVIWYSFGVPWYSIELALLHPVVKDVFAHPQRTEIQKAHKKSKKGKRHSVKYIKRHVIDTEVLENVMHENGGCKINRTTMVWYVSGHWREYKNGKRIFIQPYWKGPLRNSKKDVPPRKREIVVGLDNLGN